MVNSIRATIVYHQSKHGEFLGQDVGGKLSICYDIFMPTEVSDSTIAQPANKGAVTVFRSKGQLFTANLLGGMAWGFGSVVGATLVVALLLILLKVLGGLPLIGSYVNEIARSVTPTRR
jgi:hypothetical protein